MKGATLAESLARKGKYVSIHAPMKGATGDGQVVCTTYIEFQSTHP